MVGKLTALFYLLLVVLSPLQSIACDHLAPVDWEDSIHVTADMDMADCHKVNADESENIDCMLKCMHCAGSVASFSATVSPVVIFHDESAVEISSHILPPHDSNPLRPPIA